MHLFRRLLTALTGAALLITLGQAPAIADTESGTHAWSADTLIVRTGPSTAYQFTGEIPAELAIKVLRCQKLWCLVDAPGIRGWTYKRNISFGKTPNRWPNNGPIYAFAGPGSACFYTGTNYTGQSWCLTSGKTIKDLALLGLDNGFASLQIEGNVSVSACRDRFFQSYCEHIAVSQPALDPYLLRNLSSLRVH
ncbi:SH3 domain-containing protein [Devosia sp. YR412]|uniref:SH3 domain-containing protein n=1 Tax=Devosia sp. YR412 TaxID=1881030 RepID=UPI0008D282BC|nr:SH3 domain-containing protein [Devosia sp. YR412]SEQ02635.1 SH3 domain-containing protein [Devosia sp. YR412]